MKQSTTLPMRYASVCLVSCLFSTAHGMDERAAHKAAAKAHYIAGSLASLKNHKLIIAALVGDADSVRSLLAERANVNTIYCEGDNVVTPLMHAAKGNQPEVVDVLLASNANPSMGVVPDNATPLMIACAEGHESVVKKLLAANACPNRADRLGITPLMLAAETGDGSLVDTLIQANANVASTMSYTDITALNIAEKFGHTAVIALLKQAGAQSTSNNDVTDKK